MSMFGNDESNEFAFVEGENDSSVGGEPQDDFMESFLSDGNEDELLMGVVTARKDEEADRYRAEARATESAIEKRIAANIKRLRELNPNGGVKLSRVITKDILMDAPADFFVRFDDDVRSIVTKVQNGISDQGKSNVIAAAQEDPTNDEKQDEAYRVVNALASAELNQTIYRHTEKIIVMSLVVNEIIGFSRLDPLWRDKSINEIICNGPSDIQIDDGQGLVRVPACNFIDKAHLSGLVERLYRSVNKSVSRTTPLVDGRLHDNSRLNVVHDAAAPNGPSFVIRRHKDDYIAPEKMVEWGTASPELLSFLGNLIYKGCSVLVIGGVSTGKTTLLGALSGFARDNHRIITIEDTLELKLAPHKMLAPGFECITAAPGQNDAHEVTMRDLVRVSLRQRPDMIIVGEVRDGAAYDLCQALNTGHYGMGTLHANDEFQAIYKIVSLVSQGGVMTGMESVLPLIAASFDVIVQVDRFPIDGSRKIVSVSEVAPFPERNADTGDLWLPTRQLWKFNPEERAEGELKVTGSWEEVGKISKVRSDLRRLHMERDLTWEELKDLSNK